MWQRRDLRISTQALSISDSHCRKNCGASFRAVTIHGEEQHLGATIMHFLKSSPAVENGFLAAGATITVVCVVQSVAIILGWF